MKSAFLPWLAVISFALVGCVADEGSESKPAEMAEQEGEGSADSENTTEDWSWFIDRVTTTTDAALVEEVSSRLIRKGDKADLDFSRSIVQAKVLEDFRGGLAPTIEYVRNHEEEDYVLEDGERIVSLCRLADGTYFLPYDTFMFRTSDALLKLARKPETFEPALGAEAETQCPEPDLLLEDEGLQ